MPMMVMGGATGLLIVNVINIKMSSFKAPEEWKDEARMHFLVSEFSPRHVPTISDERVKFWRGLIHSSSRELQQWTFTKRELAQRLKWGQFEPKCLPGVIEVLERAGELRKLNSYRLDEMGWTEWSLRLMSRPITWAWKWAWQNYASQSTEDVYVLVPAVKDLCEVVVSKHHKDVIHVVTDNLMTHSQFKDLIKGVTHSGVSERCLHALELQLLEEQRIKRGVVSRTTDEVVIKFASSANSKALPVTEMDIGILGIMRKISEMEKKVEKGNEEVQKTQCVQLVRKRQKKEALALLKKIKALSRNVSNLEDKLSNLVTILDQIKSAETDSKVLKAYESGAEVLHRLRKEEGLSIDNAERIIDDLQDLLEEGDNIADITATQFGGLEIDEDELLHELEELEELEQVSERMTSLKVKEQEPSCEPSIPKEIHSAPEVPQEKPKKRLPKSKPILLS